MRSYSQIFSCLHDETGPVGNIGRGTHYSVFRVPEWRDVSRNPLTTAQIHDFAVIWDEDHDERVIAVAERLYVNGLFSPIQFIGERKGMLTIIVAARFRWSGTDADWRNWCDQVSKLCSDVGGDSWSVDFGGFDKSLGSPHQTHPEGIISDREDRVIIYLRNIDNLWNLGTWAFKDRALTPPQRFPPIPTTPLPFGSMPRAPMPHPVMPPMPPQNGVGWNQR
ncbi:hypothetical protein AWN88_14265 [Agrobacterium tumefaciens]|nr:hypothetical protein AWN88_14265 [Agrobacterium tumefaciens]KAJ34042.1 hypothetical protein BW45_06095 [Agrobacterium tumefaciens]